MKKIKKIKEVCTISGGYAFKSNDFTRQGIPIIRIGDIYGNKVNISSSTVFFKEYNEKLNKFIIEKGDILVALSGATTGKFGIYDEDIQALLNQRVAKISSKENINNNYLYHYMNKLQNIIYNKALGCAQPNISPNQIGEIEIYIPSRLEQDKISDVLDIAKGLIDKRKKQIEELDLLVKSKFIEMFGNLFKNEKQWKVSCYEEICNCITDGEHSTPRRCAKGIYLLSARNIHNHYLQLEDVDFIDENEYLRISKRIIPAKDDILISCSGSVGRVCKVPENIKFQMVRSVAILKLNSNINATFMEWLIDSSYTQQQILKSVNKSSQANLFQGKIKKLKAIVPPIELQNQFADFVNQVDKLKFEMEKSLKELENNFNSLMQKAFKGELFK